MVSRVFEKEGTHLPLYKTRRRVAITATAVFTSSRKGKVRVKVQKHRFEGCHHHDMIHGQTDETLQSLHTNERTGLIVRLPRAARSR